MSLAWTWDIGVVKEIGAAENPEPSRLVANNVVVVVLVNVKGTPDKLPELTPT